MKKSFIFSAIALASILVVACGKDDKKKTAWDEIVEDGFYVAGEATGVSEITGLYMMTQGINEADENALRDGMYEKYLVLEGGKEFYLVLNEAGTKTRYSASLAQFETPAENEAYSDNPESVLKGKLVTGDDAPAMKVGTTGLYHIVLDLNKSGDLDATGGAQILLLPVDSFGVRGGMNGWGFTAMTTTDKPSNNGITWTITEQTLAKSGEFKFSSDNGWKVTLDDAGHVKAHIDLAPGEGEGKLAINSDNIKVGDAGKYTITLTYKLAAGAIGNSFTYTTELTEKSSLPEEMYLIGEGIKGWNLAATNSDAVAMVPFHSQPGMFWAIRYIEAGKGFKFTRISTDWGSDFSGLGEDSGYTVDSGNCFVAESGVYCLGVDEANGKVVVEPAKVYGMGDVFGNWNVTTNAYTADGKLLKAVATGDGNLRTYVASSLLDDANNWWHAEFIIKDGQIVYRAGGGDPEEVAVKAGQTITFDFNEGTGSIK